MSLRRNKTDACNITVQSKIRSTNAQIKKLTEFMSLNPLFANGEYTGPLGARKMEAQWIDLKDLLQELGPDKSIEQWKQTWRDLKRKARKINAEAINAHNGDSTDKPTPIVSEQADMILSTIGYKCSTGIVSNESSICKNISTAAVLPASQQIKMEKPVPAEAVSQITEVPQEVDPLRPVCHRTQRNCLPHTQHNENDKASHFYTQDPDESTSRNTIQSDSEKSNASSTSNLEDNKNLDLITELSCVKNQMVDTVNFLKRVTENKRDIENSDECDLYAQLLAKKLKKLNERQRDIVMHEIDNVMFRAKMQSTGASQCSRTTTPPPATSTPAPVNGPHKFMSPVSVYISTPKNLQQFDEEAANAYSE